MGSNRRRNSENILKEDDLAGIMKLRGPENRLKKLIKFLEQKGFSIERRVQSQSLDDQNSIDSDTNVERKRLRLSLDEEVGERRIVDQQFERNRQEEDDQELQSLLIASQIPLIIDPSGDQSHQSNQTKSRIQERGLYARFNVDCDFLIRFGYRLKKEIDCDERSIKSYLATAGQLLAYCFQKWKLDESKVDDIGTVLDCVSEIGLADFINELVDCEAKGETMRFKLRHIKALISFIMAKYKLRTKQRLELDQSLEFLNRRTKKARRKIVRERTLKRAERFRKLNEVKLSRVWRVFELDATREKLEEAKRRIKSGSISESDYGFIVRYCVSVITLRYGLRPQVCENMTIQNWNDRQKHDNGVITFGVVDHKTAQTRKFQPVVLDRNEKKLFRFYLKRCRRVIKPLDANSNLDEEPFFVNYRKKTKLQKCSMIAKKFQAEVGAGPFFTSRDVRHIIETNSNVYLTHDPDARSAIHELLGHTESIARRAYIDQSSVRMISALEALKKLADLSDQIDTDQIGRSIDGNWNDTVLDAGDGPLESTRVHETDKVISRGPKRKIISHLYSTEEKIDLIQTQRWPGLRVVQLDGRGRGVAATCDFVKGQLICDYKGRQRTKDDHLARLEKYKEKKIEKFNRVEMYALEIETRGGKFVIEAHHEDGSFGRLFNHSKKHPNVQLLLQEMTIDGQQKPVAFFFALRKIKSGEELIWDYGELWNDAPWYHACPCGRERCQKDYKQLTNARET